MSFTPPRNRKVYIYNPTQTNQPRHKPALSISSASLAGLSTSSSQDSFRSTSTSISTSDTHPPPMEPTASQPQAGGPVFKKPAPPALAINTVVLDDPVESVSPVLTDNSGETTSSSSDERESRPSVSEGEHGVWSSSMDSHKFYGSNFIENLEHDVTQAELQAFLRGSAFQPVSVPTQKFLLPARRDRQKKNTRPFSSHGASPLSPFRKASTSDSDDAFPISPFALRPSPVTQRSMDAGIKEVFAEPAAVPAMSTAARPMMSSRSNTSPDTIPTLRTIAEPASGQDGRRMSVVFVPPTRAQRHLHSSSVDQRRPPASPTKSPAAKRPLSGLFRRPSSSASHRSSPGKNDSGVSSAAISPRVEKSEQESMLVMSRTRSSSNQIGKMPPTSLGFPRTSTKDSRTSVESAGKKPSIVVTDEMGKEHDKARRGSTSGWKKLWSAVSGKEHEPRKRSRSDATDGKASSRATSRTRSEAESEPQIAEEQEQLESPPILPDIPMAFPLDRSDWLNGIKPAPSPPRLPEIVESTGEVSRSGTIRTVRDQSSMDPLTVAPFPAELDQKLARLMVETPGSPGSSNSSNSGLGRRRTSKVSARLGQAPGSHRNEWLTQQTSTASLQRRHTAPVVVRGPAYQGAADALKARRSSALVQ